MTKLVLKENGLWNLKVYTLACLENVLTFPLPEDLVEVKVVSLAGTATVPEVLPDEETLFNDQGFSIFLKKNSRGMHRNNWWRLGTQIGHHKGAVDPPDPTAKCAVSGGDKVEGFWSQKLNPVCYW
jgi:hypothetical protein